MQTIEEVFREGLKQAEEIYTKAIAQGDYKASIEACTVIMTTKGQLLKIEDANRKFDEMKQEQTKQEFEKAEKSLSSKKK